MSGLPSDLLQKAAKHYGSYDIKSPKPSDVPIVLNYNKIAANLQSDCEGKWERELLLTTILSEVARASKKVCLTVSIE